MVRRAIGPHFGAASASHTSPLVTSLFGYFDTLSLPRNSTKGFVMPPRDMPRDTQSYYYRAVKPLTCAAQFGL
jgi:hypothetical protein